MDRQKYFWTEDFIRHMVLEEFSNPKQYGQTTFLQKMEARVCTYLSKLDNNNKSKLQSQIDDLFRKHTDGKYGAIEIRKLTQTEERNDGLTEEIAHLITNAYSYENSRAYYKGEKAIGFKVEDRKRINELKTTHNFSDKNNGGIITGFGKMEVKFLEMLKNTRQSLYLYFTDREINFAMNYVLSYFSLLKSKVKIEFNYFQTETDNQKSEKGINKVRNLKYMGLGIRIINMHGFLPPLIGVINDPYLNNGSLLEYVNSQRNIYAYTNKIFESTEIEKIYEGYDFFLNTYKVESFGFIPNLVEVEQQEYIRILKRVPEYKNLKDSDFIFTTLKPNQIASCLTHQINGIKKFKLEQHKIFNQLNELKADKIYAISLSNNYNHIINIPVLEKVNNNLYVIEGHTRLHTCWENFQQKGISSEVFVVIIDYDGFALDSELEGVEHIQVRNLKTNTNYVAHSFIDNWHNPKRRNIESYTHGAYTYDWAREFPLQFY